MTPQYKLIIRHTKALNRAKSYDFSLDLGAEYGMRLRKRLDDQVAKQDKAIRIAKAGLIARYGMRG